ncbi:AcrR family transcriptional regulator [Rhizobium tibeticum]|uniref:TetR family transcriptional regulator n=1 Tax=Rhizobium tibeticum TaxID=501024 RepID=UPI0027802A52|nr:TetR family transcriptional regulator [Rhizobium tibeticum]MDP9812861.1 AcrR family transcriptional regulator [Rhizobium tibeticum]
MNGRKEAFFQSVDDIETDLARERILDVAEKLLRHIGHRKMTLGDIAHNLGTSRANIYRFFPTRASVDHYLYVRFASRTVKVAREIAQADATARSRLAGILEAAHRQSREWMRSDRNVHALFAAAAMEKWTAGRRYFEELTSILEAVIRDGQETAELEITDPSQAARAVFTGVISFLHPVLVEQSMAEKEDTESDLPNQISFIVQAIGKPTKADRILNVMLR